MTQSAHYYKAKTWTPGRQEDSAGCPFLLVLGSGCSPVTRANSSQVSPEYHPSLAHKAARMQVLTTRRPEDCRSRAATEMRCLLTVRPQLQSKRHHRGHTLGNVALHSDSACPANNTLSPGHTVTHTLPDRPASQPEPCPANNPALSFHRCHLKVYTSPGFTFRP